MVQTKAVSWLFACLLVFLSFSTKLYAQPSQTSRLSLQSGMTLSEVQALWGEPEEVIEQELKHLSLWRYPALKNSPATTLRFVNGALVLQNSLVIENGLSKLVAKNSLAMDEHINNKNGIRLDMPVKRAIKDKPHSFMALKDQKEVTDVLKEVPSEADAPEKPGLGTSAASPISPVQIE